MPYTLMQKFKMVICKLFGHFPYDYWEYNGQHAKCRCCNYLIHKRGGKWE